jgi:4-amino-4-deoxy-L-arabinose transferase-like glycosyltransferase
MINFWTRYKYWICLGLLFLILRLPSLFEPYWYGDEGIYLTLGQGIRKGLLLYSQIHDNKPPTLYYLAAISQTVFGFRLLLGLVMIPTIFFFYKLALHFFDSKFAKISTFIFLILTSIPCLEGNIANAEVFMLLPTILGILYFLTAKKKISYLASGLFLGLAFSIKIPVFIEVLFLVVWFVLSNISKIKQHFWSLFLKLILFGAGFLTPILIYLVYFSIHNVFWQFLNSALLQNFSYLSSWATGTQTAPASSGGLMTRLLLLIIFWVIVYLLQFKKIISQKTSFLFFWFGATIFGVLLSTRPYPHYLIQALPPFCLIIPLLLKSKIDFKKIFTLIVFFISFLIIKKYQFYFYPTLKYYSNFYSFQSTASYYQFFGDQTNNNYQIASYIKKNTTPTDRIFVWGDEPYLYALSDRLPVGRYTVAYHIVDFNGYQETIDAIKAHSPKFVVYYPMSNRSFPDLDYLLNRYYFLDKIFGSVLVFEKR